MVFIFSLKQHEKLTKQDVDSLSITQNGSYTCDIISNAPVYFITHVIIHT